MRVIDHETRRSVDIKRRITDDADDLERRAVADGNPLADHAVERHSGKRRLGKVGTHHRASWSALIVASIERAAGKQRDVQRFEEIATYCALLDVEPVSCGHRCARSWAADDGCTPPVIAPC